MPLFELGGANGTDNALSGADNDYTIDSDTFTDVLVFNNSDTSVYLTLTTGHADLVWSDEVPEHQRARVDNQHRGHRVDGRALHIDALEASSVFIARVTNGGDTNGRPWLDKSACTLYEQGHGTNIFNGQRVYVIPYNSTSFNP